MNKKDMLFMAAISSPRSEEHHHNHNTKITVEEMRAPTDDSVKMLKEMEEKAHSKMREAFFIGMDDNSLSGVVADMGYDCRSNKIMAYVMFTLNGKKYEDRFHVSEFGEEASIELFYKALTESVSKSIMGTCGKLLMNKRRF